MSNPFSLFKEASIEAHKYFDANIRPLAKNSEGEIDEFHPGLAGNDVDAFRHAYVSGVYTQEYGESVAWFLGGLWEMTSGDPLDRNMDLWNNQIGRKLGLKYDKRKSLADAIKKALDSGELITSGSESEGKVYQGTEAPNPKSGFSVVVLKESDTGANELFFDLARETLMTREEFVGAIKAGSYPGYTVRSISGVIYPASKPDGKGFNNLG